MDKTKLEKLAKLVRYYSLLSCTEAGSGHRTSSLSAVELMVGLMFGGSFKYDLENPEYHSFKGLVLDKAAKILDMEPVDALLHIIEKDELRTGGIFFGMCEENMWRILAQPWVMIGCDASLRAPDGILSKDHPHPRAYGSFTKLLRASLDAQTVPLPEMIRKMTSLAARQFRLNGRGELKTGNFADVVVFSPDKIKENTTYGNPHRLSGGIETLVVNGTLTIQNGQLTGTRGGQFLG